MKQNCRPNSAEKVLAQLRKFGTAVSLRAPSSKTMQKYHGCKDITDWLTNILCAVIFLRH